ncbi:Uncharacterised protein [Mycobacteroides abscessus subsp. bolletii]|uniref:hypothetical protein n=1 Tax=Mycobacteroides abscessus TaxID=36809 RepID=UPI0009A5C839|nr:hypothetical protein [Mycobacteroides abscessus]QSN49629.1 hypothetical protein I3U33_26495 [Mycobacteroides abscessus subsp. abscessus]SKS74670.1 Uncharacterised protein [Mycobacteroides abscessus subsp. bolletii]SKS82053.1 Uncharacterised protein [Mycobacteroides abscessus subsp. bolletii]
MSLFEAKSRDHSIIVTVDLNGTTKGITLEPAAMDLTEAELCGRIVRLNTLAYMRSQLAIRLQWEANKKEILGKLPTEIQVARYAETIDF